MENLKQNWELSKTQAWKSHQTWARTIIFVLLVLGVFFRFVNLDHKVYWYDETITSLRISGYRQTEVVRQVFNNHEISVEDLQKYQRISPEKGLIDTARSLASEAPQHPPLYFVMARFWGQWLGNSVAVPRSLSVLISLLTFPCLYWLCLELFDSSLVGWVAITLIAVSPFHILYAQEAREYSLWTVTTLLSSATLLRAMRLNTKLSWVTYAVTLAVGLYSFTFSFLVAIGHAIYVVAIEKFRLTKTVAAYLLACLAGFLAFTPWLLVIIIHLFAVGRLSAWTDLELSLLSLIQEWLLNLSRIFLDLNLNYDKPLIYLIIPILILEAYSIYFVCRKTPKRIWLFLLTLIGVTGLTLILPDLLLGGRRSSVARYLIPCYLGIQLAVAYLFTTQIVFASFKQRKMWQVMIAVLISVEVVSCVFSSQAEVWWNKYESSDNPQVAHIINQANHPLLISDPGINIGYIISLSYLLEPKVQLRLLTEPNLPQIPNNFQNVFLYRPSESLRHQLEKKYRVEPVYAHSNIWKLEN